MLLIALYTTTLKDQSGPLMIPFIIPLSLLLVVIGVCLFLLSDFSVSMVNKLLPFLSFILILTPFYFMRGNTDAQTTHCLAVYGTIVSSSLFCIVIITTVINFIKSNKEVGR